MDKINLTFEQKQQLNKDTFRQIMGLTYVLIFLPCWFVFLFMCITEFGFNAMEGLALGTATGVFLAAFKDLWQFIWRKS